jgi:hypothetical protein
MAGEAILQAIGRLSHQVDSLARQMATRYQPETQRVKAALSELKPDEVAKRLVTLEKQVRDLMYPKPRPPRTPMEALEQIPGYRHPMEYQALVNFDIAQSGQARSDTIVISPGGPFLLTGIDALFRVNDDDGDIPGRFMPVSGYRYWAEHGVDDDLATLAARQLAYQPELDFQLEVEGSGRLWTNRFLPLIIFDPAKRASTTVGAMGWLDPTDRLKITVAPQNPTGIPKAGTVFVTFKGIEIVNPVRLGDIIRL